MAPLTALEKLEVSRNTIEINITSLETKLQAHIAKPLTLAKVLTHLTTSESIDTRLAENYDRIINAVTDMNDLTPHTSEYTSLYNRNLDVRVEFEELKALLTPVKVITPVSTVTVPEIRLPRLTLPNFSGDLQEWSSYRDVFKSSVHDNPKLTNVQKLTYLKSTVSGEAARLIQSISLTDASYDIAWSQLIARYQNERELLFHILRRLFTQPSVQINSASSLRSLIDVTKECLRSLEAINRPVQYWDDILLYHMFQRLDQPSKELWEQSLKDSSIPLYAEFLEFLEARARALAAGSTSTTQGKSQGTSRQDSRLPTRVSHVNHVNTTSKCSLCNSGDHMPFKCTAFGSMTAPERLEMVKKSHLCFNCLRPGHSSSSCSIKGTCQKCQRKHHTLIHQEREKANGDFPSTPTIHTTVLHTNGDSCIPQTILATSIVNIRDQFGHKHVIRALQDGCSNSSFITEACYRQLGLSRRRIDIELTGVGGISLGKTKGKTTAIITPHFSALEITVQLLIVPTITGIMPEQWCDPSSWSHLNGLQLADPEFHKPSQVDMLLGADVFWAHLKDGRRYGTNDAPVAVNSTFGWLVAGRVSQTASRVSAHLTDSNLDERIQRFWEIESSPTLRVLTAEEKQCEAHFKQSHTKNAQGRFIVKLPLKSTQHKLGQSRDIAVNRLQQLEKRLARLPDRYTEYRKFMFEYLSLGHMERIPHNEINLTNSLTCYIPHHFVMKESSTTTKLRVVFDASAKTSSGVSLNDCLMVGPRIQDSLIDILTNFRIFPFALNADLEKMFRQIQVTHDDTNLQRIVWREAPNLPIQDYRLLTVTYGTASAPYLATKTLQQLALDSEVTYPLASKAFMNNMYVDDLMGGASSKTQAADLLTELLKMTSNAGLQFRKWSSNCPSLLSSLPPEHREQSTLLEIDNDQTIKALGVYWNTSRDQFQFKVTTCNEKYEKLTKRILLSETAKLFDPLGWLGPVVIRAKILIQQLWKEQIGWDEILPVNFQREWYEFRDNLSHIEKCKISRCMMPQGYQTAHLVGFSDASEKAYAAVVYMVARGIHVEPFVTLISSKTRVAPAKPVSLPRLELCGALLLAQLMTSISQSLRVEIKSKLAYTDSTIVMDWIGGHPSQWTTFVANRVTQIQELLPIDSWRHVSGVDNPADCASRGIDPSELPLHPLWWQGPSWLKYEVIPEPVVYHNSTMQQEERKQTTRVNHVRQDISMLNQFSSLSHLFRVTAWIQRFVHNCRVRIQVRKSCFPAYKKLEGTITVNELQDAELCWIRVIQQQEFHEEIHSLSKFKTLPIKSRILSLTPFLDSSQVLRVGGRLRNAQIPVSQRNPILIPRHHQFTRLLITNEHLKHLHAGPQLVLSTLTRRFWILGAKDAIRHIIKKCVVCTRHSATLQQQLMGDLPSSRVTPTRPFLSCGVDYAGPLLLRSIQTRSKVTYKAYLAVFVCFSTRAIHIEVVTVLTTDAFLAAFRRFIARRGKPNDIHSDRGTNFVGSAAEMKEFKRFLANSTTNEHMSKELSNDHIRWHFNPAGSPHMGGLWEAGVKSAKYHLHRIVGSYRLTYEELTTTVNQIEACLNSRPLTAISTDPNDLTALTPGHFLIGGPMTSMPEPCLKHLKDGHLSRWQLVQRMTQHFWTRWSNEFVSRMQQRPKWQQQIKNIQLNSLVIIKDERLPPLKWKLGRVIALHPGADGLVRVVTLKTADGEIQRPIVKICLLPIDSDNEI